MKRWLYWCGIASVLIIEFCLMANKFLVIHNGVLYSLGGMWLWRGIAGFLKMDGMYRIELTRNRQIVLAIIDFSMGLSWIALSLTEASKQIIPISLVSVPFIIATALVCYYKNGKTE